MSPREKVRFQGKSNARCFGAWCKETEMVNYTKLERIYKVAGTLEVIIKL